VALGLAERRHVAQGRAVGRQQLDDTARTKALEAFAQAQDRQRTVEATRIDDERGRRSGLILRHGEGTIL
jgi:hypothetical protein